MSKHLLDGTTYQEIKKEAEEEFDNPGDKSMHISVWGGHGGNETSETCRHIVENLGFDGYECEKCRRRWI